MVVLGGVAVAYERGTPVTPIRPVVQAHYRLCVKNEDGEGLSRLKEGGQLTSRAGFNPQPPTLNPQLSTINPQPSTLNPQPSTLNPQPSTLRFDKAMQRLSDAATMCSDEVLLLLLLYSRYRS